MYPLDIVQVSWDVQHQVARAFKFSNNRSPLSCRPEWKYIPAPQVGSTGISRDFFDEIIRYIRYYEQPPNPSRTSRPEGMSSDKYRWMLVDGVVSRFNEYWARCNEYWARCFSEGVKRLARFSLTQRVGTGLMMGCCNSELQNNACGRSGVMLRLRNVKKGQCW